MSRIILSADSTCDLSAELRERYDVRYYPFHVEFRGKSYRDNVDITPCELFEGYREDGSLPKTAAINVQEYLDHFSSLVSEGCEVVHVSLGGALSSAHQNAVLAAEQLEGVHVVDSCNLSTGAGQLVIRAGRMIEQGMGAAEIACELELMRERVHSSFVLGTLEFMAAGGRCPAVLSHVGKALHFRAGIDVDNSDGSMGVGRLHHGSMSKALRNYVRDTLAKHEADGIMTDDVFITHSGIDERLIEQVRAQLLEELPFERVHVTVASCTISCHCGPGTLGILFVTER